MRERYREMSGSQRRLADYILEKPYQIAFASAAKIGEELGISSATVVRFADFLGLGGFTDLQEVARDALHRELSEVTHLKRAASVLNGESILHRSLRADIESIQRSGQLITEEAFDRAVHLITEASTVYIAGFRSTFGLAHMLGFNLNLIGRRAVVMAPNVGDLPEQLLPMKAGDVCIAISFKRYTAQVADVMDYAREKGVSVIALTDSELSPMGDKADVSLPVAVKFPSFLESRAASLSVISALLSAVAFLLRDETAASLERHEDLWARYGTYLDESSPRSVGTHVGAFVARESHHQQAGARQRARGSKPVRRRGGRKAGERGRMRENQS
jgi:DNA-binding MurR/RpiR family transcriptional regulator